MGSLWEITYCLFLPLSGCQWRWPCSLLPRWWPVLLLVPSRIHGCNIWGSCPCNSLYNIYVGILCILLQDLDRGVWLISKRCRCSTLIVFKQCFWFRTNQLQTDQLLSQETSSNCETLQQFHKIMFFAGCQATQRTANGDERPQGYFNGSWA